MSLGWRGEDERPGAAAGGNVVHIHDEEAAGVSFLALDPYASSSAGGYRCFVRADEYSLSILTDESGLVGVGMAEVFDKAAGGIRALLQS